VAWRISRGIDAIGDEGWANTGPQVIVDLAAQLGISSEERDLDVYDAVTADEVFLTSTSLCICGVRSLNGARIADGVVRADHPAPHRGLREERGLRLRPAVPLAAELNNFLPAGW
jgi:hypothetical protein